MCKKLIFEVVGQANMMHLWKVLWDSVDPWIVISTRKVNLNKTKRQTKNHKFIGTTVGDVTAMLNLCQTVNSHDYNYSL